MHVPKRSLKQDKSAEAQHQWHCTSGYSHLVATWTALSFTEHVFCTLILVILHRAALVDRLTGRLGRDNLASELHELLCQVHVIRHGAPRLINARNAVVAAGLEEADHADRISSARMNGEDKRRCNDTPSQSWYTRTLLKVLPRTGPSGMGYGVPRWQSQVFRHICGENTPETYAIKTDMP